MLLPFQLGTLPSGVCFTTEQQRYNAYMTITQAVLNGMAPDKPTVVNQAYPWLRTTDGRWYFYSGVWISPTNYTYEDRRLYAGTLTQLASYDGGTPGIVTSTSGPMWVEDTTFQGRSPMGPGAIPTSNPAVTLNVNANAGEGAHTQTTAEMVPHQHGPDDLTSDAFLGHAKPGKGTYNVGGGGDTSRFALTAPAGGNASLVAEPSNVVHPVRGIYVIMWSGRANFAVP